MDDERIRNLNVLFKIYDVPYLCVKSEDERRYIINTSGSFNQGSKWLVTWALNIDSLEEKVHEIIAQIQAAREGDIVGVNSN